MLYPSDIEEAHELWGANCGPCSLAAVLDLSVSDVRGLLINVQYRFTHWIGIAGDVVFEVNAPHLTTFESWKEIMPEAIKEEGHGNGKFTVRAGIEIFGGFEAAALNLSQKRRISNGYKINIGSSDFRVDF